MIPNAPGLSPAIQSEKRKRELAVSSPGVPRQGRWVQNAWRLLALPLLSFFLVPLVVLVFQTTPARIVASFQDPIVYLALWTSLKTTLISLVLILIFGTPLALLLGRYQFRSKSIVDTLIDMPTVLPPSVAGLALLLTFGRTGPLGSVLADLHIVLAFSQPAVVMAQIFIAAPYYIRAASLGFAAIDSEYIQAAQLDGAGRWSILRYLVFPLAHPALISGALMSWARALGEFGATILFAGNFLGRTQTMPMAIYLGFESNLDVALTLSVILILVSFFSLAGVKAITGKASDSQN
ncbi:MAG TPA: ABC transporter permease [Anaerolineaceae bacterium]|nr:ABC transporter permease [Anaerolineaceae bacterium]